MDKDFSKMRVLLIEDDRAARSMCRDMLFNMGFTHVFEASDGAEGLQYIDMAADMVDLIVCDWNMPQMTGIEVLREVRLFDKETPFLMLTGRGDMGSVVEAKSAGVSAYIVKPFSMMQFEGKMRSLYFNAMRANSNIANA